MFIKLQCKCGKPLRVREEYAGKRLKCPACGATAAVPQGSTETNPGASPPPAPESINVIGGGSPPAITPFTRSWFKSAYFIAIFLTAILFGPGTGLLIFGIMNLAFEDIGFSLGGLLCMLIIFASYVALPITAIFVWKTIGSMEPDEPPAFLIRFGQALCTLPCMWVALFVMFALICFIPDSELLRKLVAAIGKANLRSILGLVAIAAAVAGAIAGWHEGRRHVLRFWAFPRLPKHPESFSAGLHALKHADPYVRKSAIEFLKAMKLSKPGGNTVIEALRLLKDDPDEHVKASATEALGVLHLASTKLPEPSNSASQKARGSRR